MSPSVLLLLAVVVLLSAVVGLLAARERKLRRLLALELKEKQQIISIVSHDIKSPFNRISALAQLFNMEKGSMSEQQQEYINKMLQTVADGLALIRNLVDYRNLEYRGIEINPEQLDISQLVHGKVKSFHSLAASKSITLNTDITPTMMVVSDNQCVSRVLDNLIGNAIKFSSAQHHVFVSVKPSSNGHVIVQVRDESGGFTEEDLGRLYKKFTRLTAKPTSGESSTGLGLFITKAMLSRIGGQIQCITKYGEGSTFTVTIPTQLRMAV